MNHYKAKRVAEQELREIFEHAGFGYIENISNQSEIISSTKPLYYNIEAHELADSAKVDGACIYAVFRQVSSPTMRSDDNSDFVQMSYSLNIWVGGKLDTITKYIDDLQTTLSDNEWSYSFVSEDKVKATSGAISPLVQLVYNLDKIIDDIE